MFSAFVTCMKWIGRFIITIGNSNNNYYSFHMNQALLISGQILCIMTEQISLRMWIMTHWGGTNEQKELSQALNNLLFESNLVKL